MQKHVLLLGDVKYIAKIEIIVYLKHLLATTSTLGEHLKTPDTSWPEWVHLEEEEDVNPAPSSFSPDNSSWLMHNSLEDQHVRVKRAVSLLIKSYQGINQIYNIRIRS